MNYLSVCSGIEAATCAWHSLGWQAVAYSEIEPFPSAILTHRYPHVPNLGDMTQYKEWQLDRTVELLVGGTPCQSFSVAGLRKGMDDPRGNLALVFLGIADKFKPQWIVWENVPGVLSSSGGRDFGSFLGGLAELGYGFAYRVLDAQYFGVAQRRRRVFVVGYLGDWRPASAVLFERHSLCGHPAPSRKTRETTANSFEGGPRTGSFYESSLAQYRKDNVGGTLKATGGVLSGGSETFIVKPVELPILYERLHGGRTTENAQTSPTLAARTGTGGNNMPIVYTHVAETSPTLLSSAAGFSRPGNAVTEHETYIAYGFEPGITKGEGNPNRFNEEVSPTLRAEMGDNQVAIALAENTIGRQPQNGGNGNGFTIDGPMYTLNATGVHGVAHAHRVHVSEKSNTLMARDYKGINSDDIDTKTIVEVSSHAFKVRGGCEGGGKGYLGKDELAFTISTNQDQHIAFNVNARPDEMKFTSEATSTLTHSQNVGIMQHMAVRRLTPTECERLQGFPDGYTNVPWRGKPEAPDGPRYKALGNSMAVPVMHWIGQRIQSVENELKNS